MEGLNQIPLGKKEIEKIPEPIEVPKIPATPDYGFGEYNTSINEAIQDVRNIQEINRVQANELAGLLGKALHERLLNNTQANRTPKTNTPPTISMKMSNGVYVPEGEISQEKVRTTFVIEIGALVLRDRLNKIKNYLSSHNIRVEQSQESRGLLSSVFKIKVSGNKEDLESVRNLLEQLMEQNVKF